ncbi:AAA family ATPase [Polynucleobacter sp. MG-Unter2-18]|uniref:AAA family ATPase n=1 Tax=Polynucleobacter sp. MG-Unter2-18 TaxID=2081052 RepID=UPI001BFDE681|nr:AAA family ATPase [Polynucleobacter sp. MG-Unter2-18]QWD95239.1 AAA family ATPase [Polynucleobacter sp. MG-Unter2-18]
MYSQPEIKAVGLDTFLKLSLPKKDKIMSPWLDSSSLNMIHAPRGIGKTHVAIGIAYALATGGEFLCWKVPSPKKVLYIDGEMTASAMQDRFNKKLNDAVLLQSTLTNLSIITPDLQERLMPDLASAKGQLDISKHTDLADVIIVDNLSCLVRSSADENSAESWNTVLEWSLKMKRERRAVIFIHHSGKSGQQRGTSRKEDSLDVVINLRRPENYCPTMGARFEVHYEKNREWAGKEAKPFVAQLTQLESGEYQWVTSPSESSTRDRVIEAYKRGCTNNSEIAKEIGVDRTTVFRHAQDAKHAGEL